MVGRRGGHGPAARNPDLAIAQADQEAAYLTRTGIGTEQLVAANAVHDRVDIIVLSLTPQAPGGVEGQTIRRGKQFAIDGADAIGRYGFAVVEETTVVPQLNDTTGQTLDGAGAESGTADALAIVRRSTATRGRIRDG